MDKTQSDPPGLQFRIHLLPTNGEKTQNLVQWNYFKNSVGCSLDSTILLIGKKVTIQFKESMLKTQLSISEMFFFIFFK